MNPIDKLVEVFSPESALRRASARRALAFYEAAVPSKSRKFRRDQRSPDLQVQQGAVAIRNQARHLEQNHDIARGIIRTMVNNVVGPSGIGIEPQPRRKDGTVHEEYARALREMYRDWSLCPEVTQRHSWARVQRLMARTWLRDGEAFSQRLFGAVQFLDHGTKVPYSLEMIEPDMIPMSYNDPANGIVQGIQRNVWGKPNNYYVYKYYPGDITASVRPGEMKTVPADNMFQIAMLDRIGQLRGVSEFASVITRLEDIKDYEESERIAAKIAAMLTAYVKKGNPEMYPAGQSNLETGPDGKPLPREIPLSPGMIVDSLAIGEDIGLIDSKRPNVNLLPFRQGQIQAVAAGVGASASSISKSYDGTYSAQRQELVEQWVHYAVLMDEFTGQYIQPVWADLVMVAHLSGVVRMPADLDVSTADDAIYIGQSMPWIDPMKEALAWQLLVQCGFASEVEVIRRRGGNPRDVLEQIGAFRELAQKKGLTFAADIGAVTVAEQASGVAPANAQWRALQHLLASQTEK